MEKSVGYEGSGIRAENEMKRTLQEADQEIEKEMEALRIRAANGENVDNEVRALKAKHDRLRQIRG